MAKTSKRVSIPKKRLIWLNTDRIWLKQSKLVVACNKILPGRHPCDVIQYLRLGESLTINEISKKLGVHKSTVSRWSHPDVVGLQHYTEKSKKSSLRCIRRINSNKKRKYKNGIDC